jgi:hypothetical protein
MFYFSLSLPSSDFYLHCGTHVHVFFLLLLARGRGEEVSYSIDQHKFFYTVTIVEKKRELHKSPIGSGIGTPVEPLRKSNFVSLATSRLRGIDVRSQN